MDSCGLKISDPRVLSLSHMSLLYVCVCPSVIPTYLCPSLSLQDFMSSFSFTYLLFCQMAARRTVIQMQKFICLSVLVCVSVHLSISLSTWLCLCVCLSVHLYLCMTVYISSLFREQTLNLATGVSRSENLEQSTCLTAAAWHWIWTLYMTFKGISVWRDRGTLVTHWFQCAVYKSIYLLTYVCPIHLCLSVCLCMTLYLNSPQVCQYFNMPICLSAYRSISDSGLYQRLRQERFQPRLPS